jgi:hypothetical protein
MTETKPPVPPVAPRPEVSESEKQREREFNEAVERVYQRYGSDLSAFRRDLENTLTKRA